MKRFRVSSLFAVLGAIFGFSANGCEINPWFPQDITYLNGGGTGGLGGSGGTGGLGGTGGAGGEVLPCVCSDDSNDCTDDFIGQACPSGDEMACHHVVTTRQCSASDGSAGYCDANGSCQACKMCENGECSKPCNGQCQGNDDCMTGYCADGYCCDNACDGPCNACNRVNGTCSPLPFALVGECPMGQVCGNGTNACVVQGKAPLGALCTYANDCQTGLCRGQVCVSPNGQPCVENLECASYLCDSATHTCVSCAEGHACPEGASCLSGGRCPAFPGQPATDSADCVMPSSVSDDLTCTLPVGAPCTTETAFECLFRRCTNGKCAPGCFSDGDCPAGLTCHPNGGCRLPQGSYCVIDDQCQGPVDKGTCAGFPRKCQ
jgi:hypothetical protein